MDENKLEEKSTDEYSLPERAKFGDRFFAAIVDNIIVNIPLRVISFFFAPLWSSRYFALIIISIVELIVILGYFAGFAFKKGGQTWGKKWNKVKVVDLEGNNLTLIHFIIREFVARGIPIIMSIYLGLYANLWLLTYLSALSKERRAFHDIIAGTQVIKLK